MRPQPFTLQNLKPDELSKKERRTSMKNTNNRTSLYLSVALITVFLALLVGTPAMTHSRVSQATLNHPGLNAASSHDSGKAYQVAWWLRRWWWS